ncbi:MAG TPA: hypothetical protein VFU81_10850 [Thermomicrobiales bacterium]|nr:hypothetical protein [Thermomicrobiales bacterium]
MDGNTFDGLTRALGMRRSRRDALKSIAAGLVGLGAAKGASAQITPALATCGQRCTASTDCNAGLRCSRPSGSAGLCVAIADSRTGCTRNLDCGRDFEVCRNRRCVNQSSCDRCNLDADCPTGKICRNTTCRECTRDRQCPRRRVCRNGRCERNRDECNRNRDCGRNQRCRNGRCVRR